MIYYFVINNRLLDNNSTLDVSDDVFWLIGKGIKGSALGDEGDAFRAKRGKKGLKGEWKG